MAERPPPSHRGIGAGWGARRPWCGRVAPRRTASRILPAKTCSWRSPTRTRSRRSSRTRVRPSDSCAPGRHDSDAEPARLNRGALEGIGTRSEIRAGSCNRSSRITGSTATRRFRPRRAPRRASPRTPPRPEMRPQMTARYRVRRAAYSSSRARTSAAEPTSPSRRTNSSESAAAFVFSRFALGEPRPGSCSASRGRPSHARKLAYTPVE